MFGTNKELKYINERLDETNRRLIELKTMLFSLEELIVQNKIEIKRKNKPLIVTKEVTKEVNKNRKKRRPELTRKKGFTQVTKEERQEFKRLYDKGFTVSEIAAQAERSQSCISKHLHQMLDGIETK